MAIIFVNAKNIDRSSVELILTIVVLALLIFFAVKGSGPFSADEYFRRGAAMDKKTQRNKFIYSTGLCYLPVFKDYHPYYCIEWCHDRYAFCGSKL